MINWQRGLAVPVLFTEKAGIQARTPRNSLLQDKYMLDLPFFLARTQGELANSLTLLGITAIETLTGLEVSTGVKKKRLLIRMFDWFIYHSIRLWRRDRDPNWLVAISQCHRVLAVLTGRSPMGCGLTVGGAGAPLTTEQWRFIRISLDWLGDYLARKKTESFLPLPQEEKLQELSQVWLAAQDLEGMAGGKVVADGQKQELDWSRIKIQPAGLYYDDRVCLIGPLARQKIQGYHHRGYLAAMLTELKVMLPKADKLLTELGQGKGEMGSRWPERCEGELQLFLETPAGPAGLQLRLERNKVAAARLFTPDLWLNSLWLEGQRQGILTETDIYALARDWGIPVSLTTGRRL